MRFAKYTKQILEALPYWFSMRKQSKNSIGAHFLNLTGLTLDEIRYVIDYAYQQVYLSETDINLMDFCYKAILPMNVSAKNITAVYDGNVPLFRATSLKEFYKITPESKQLTQLYFVDELRNIVYVAEHYNRDAIHEYGTLQYEYNKKRYEEPLIPHKIWNFFDEFGLLLDCERLPMENNQEYKERLFDVFLHPANASKNGLINGIARELGLRKQIFWQNTRKPLILSDPMIVLNSITVDGNEVPLSYLGVNEVNQVVLSPMPTVSPEHAAIVRYVTRLEMHQFNNKEDKRFQSELFTVDHLATEQLRYYIKRISKIAPIFWNDFKWNEHYWDPNDASLTGFGVVPTLYDASISGFSQYKGESS